MVFEVCLLAVESGEKDSLPAEVEYTRRPSLENFS